MEEKIYLEVTNVMIRLPNVKKIILILKNFLRNDFLFG